MKASILLEQSEQPFYEACIKVKKLEDALEELVRLKDYKDKNGKDLYYLNQQTLAWAAARELLK